MALTDNQGLANFHNVCFGLPVVPSLNESNLHAGSVPPISRCRLERKEGIISSLAGRSDMDDNLLKSVVRDGDVSHCPIAFSIRTQHSLQSHNDTPESGLVFRLAEM